MPRRLAIALVGIAVAGAAATARAEVLHEPVRIRPLDCRDGICRSTATGAANGAGATAKNALPEAIVGPDGKLVTAPTPTAVKPDETPWSPLDPSADNIPGPSAAADPSTVPPAAAAKHRVGNYQIDRDTGPESGKHPYEEVFRPSIYPFKRSTALDSVVAGSCAPARAGCVEPALAVARAALEPRKVDGNHRLASYDYFWGELAIELAGERATPLPSPGPEAVVVAYETVPPQTIDFFVDSAENWYVRGKRSGRTRIVWLTGVPKRAFGGPLDPSLRVRDLPSAMVPRVPDAVRALAAPIRRKLGLDAVTGNDTLAPVIDKLVDYFRSFETRLMLPGSGSTYLDLALSRAGSCRHRSYAFVITAQSIGLPARYIENELHVFVEIWLPNSGWRRVHLGGAGIDSDRIGEGGPSHRPPEDTLPKPPEFLASEREASEKQQQADAKGAAGAQGKGKGKSKGSEGAPSIVAGGTNGGSAGTAFDALRKGATRGSDTRRAVRILPKLSVELGGTAGFRGETVEVRGRASGDAGGLARLPVYVVLSGPEGQQRIAEGITDEQGDYRIAIELPKTLPLGDYRVLVGTDGDDERAPALTP